MTTATFDFMAPATGKCVPIEAVHHSLSDRTLGERHRHFPEQQHGLSLRATALSPAFPTMLSPCSTASMTLSCCSPLTWRHSTMIFSCTSRLVRR